MSTRKRKRSVEYQDEAARSSTENAEGWQAEEVAQTKKKNRKKSDDGVPSRGVKDETGATPKHSSRKKNSRRKKSDDGVPSQGVNDEPGTTTNHASREKKSRRKKVAAEGERLWKEEGFDGSLTRNIVYTDEEKRRIMDACRTYCTEKGLDVDEFFESLKYESHHGRGSDIWTKIGGIAGIERRSVLSMSSKVKRIIQGTHGHWTTEEVEKLRDFVIDNPGRPKWKEIGQALGISPQSCRDKWRAALTPDGEIRTRGGGFTHDELWALRQGVVESTNNLAPVDYISWRKVQKYLPHKSQDDCRKFWYQRALPQLLEYEDKHGIGIDPDVFKRHILRQIKKCDCEDFEDVLWANVNPFWPAWMNRDFVKRAWRFLPPKWKLVSRGGYVLDECDLPHFQDCIAELAKDHLCKKFKKQDRRTLKHAKLVLEGQAQQLSSDTSDYEAGD